MTREASPRALRLFALLAAASAGGCMIRHVTATGDASQLLADEALEASTLDASDVVAMDAMDASDAPVLPIDAPDDLVSVADAIDAGPVCTDPGAVACAGRCVQTASDPAHCGACSRACAYPNATAMCAGGECAFGACITGFADCDGDPANGCEVLGACPASCADLPTGATSGAYTLYGPTGTWRAYCDMTTAGGPWTLVLKVDGLNDTFAFGSMHWENATVFNPMSTDLSRTEAKFEGFNSLAFTRVRLVFVEPTESPETQRALEFAQVGDSLRAVFADGYRATSRGRAAWMGLMRSPSLQRQCDREGFNSTQPDGRGEVRVRLGILGNDQNDCNSPDSYIGIGGARGFWCIPSGTNSAGNAAGCNANNGDRNTRVWAYLFVR